MAELIASLRPSDQSAKGPQPWHGTAITLDGLVLPEYGAYRLTLEIGGALIKEFHSWSPSDPHIAAGLGQRVPSIRYHRETHGQATQVADAPVTGGLAVTT